LLIADGAAQKTADETSRQDISIQKSTFINHQSNCTDIDG
jgi:hypothetical protein